MLILDARAWSVQTDYRSPIKFGGRVVTDVVTYNVEVTVELANGRQAVGFGTMPMGNVWAWPSQVVSGERTLEAMCGLAEALTNKVASSRWQGHPLELSERLEAEQSRLSREISERLGLAEAMPVLAQRVAASPIDAALHDAFGKAHQRNAYDCLGSEYIERDLSTFLNDDFRGEYLDQYTSRQPQPSMPLYHLVGALDPLSAAEITQPLGDGLPESLGDWILADGLTHLKIKLAGDDLSWDVARVLEVERVAEEAQRIRGCSEWVYSLDFNERCENVEYVLEFLRRLEQASPLAFERTQYIEQPTHRDLKAHPENRMHAAAEIKPVVIDESLVDFESLQCARDLGYSGVALKACKGQSEALLMGAAAQKYGLFLCVQDLTCIGGSFLHSASLAARVPSVQAIEGNGRQYCPAGNRGWRKAFPGMFQIQDGTVRTAELSGIGLGGWNAATPAESDEPTS